MARSTAAEATKHNIIIDNVTNEEIICYPLLIVKGHIQNLGSCNHTPETKLIITIAQDLIQKPIKNNQTFQFLIDLSLGRNIITLSYCYASTTTILEYQPKKTELNIVPLYIICKGDDGRFQAPETEASTIESACRRILTGCKIIQSVFAEKLHEAGFKRKTFQMDLTGSFVFCSRLTVEEVYKMGQTELWYYFAREIMTSPIGSDKKKYLTFLSCTRYDDSKYKESMSNQEDLIKLTRGYVAFGGDGLALLGSACLYTWPENVEQIEQRFEDKALVHREKFLDDSCYRGTLGGCYSTTLGATLHELCHTFGLGHSDTGIMARGFDQIQNLFLLNGNNAPIQRSTYKRSLMISQDKEANFTENNLIFLNYHKWFCDPKSKKAVLSYESNSGIVKSTAGLRVVEIRRKTDEMVLRYWIFKQKILKYSFQIPADSKNIEESVLVIEDNEGNILKEDF